MKLVGDAGLLSETGDNDVDNSVNCLLQRCFDLLIIF